MLTLLQRFFQICTQRNLVITLPKSNIFAKWINWSGRINDGDGYCYGPATYEALKSTVEPTNAADSCQLINASTWMGNAIHELEKKLYYWKNFLKSCTAPRESRKRKL